MKYRTFFLVVLSGISSFALAQSVNRFIIVDQFGYLPQAEKIAVIKDPVTGFDAPESFVPGPEYVVVNSITGERIFRGQPVAWNSGNTDLSSGDKAWHFDFSVVTDTGHYHILDSANNVRSYEFVISSDVYRNVLKHAVRTFFYQRAGFEKDAIYAGDSWADGASHIGPLQDKNCRVYNDKANASTERDLHGGWYDAGDYNKYTNWTANYVVEMMKAFLENTAAWGDDYNIPESGNGIPDLLDEAKWGVDHLLRMQEANGSVLSIVSLSHDSPPSEASGQSVYGPATTSATLNTAAAFAISAKAYRSMNMNAYADSLIRNAEKAWNWAVANPSVIFHNNSSSNGSQGVGAGDQEEDDYGRSMSKLEAACFLFEATGNTAYRKYFDSNYRNAHLLQWNFAYPYEPAVQDLLLYYSQLPGATASVANQIKSVYRNAMLNNTENFPARNAFTDPYMAHMKEYTWGSNNQKGAQGSMYYNLIRFQVDPALNDNAQKAAAGYIHYIHGVNPLNLVYLSNMYAFGGDSCVNEFYHSWFTNGSEKWDRVGTSLYGPAPGFVPGGPNPSYDWDGCCNTSSCGSSSNNAICASESLSPPKDQPKQKSYKDFNTSWPLNSWSVTENSCGYQVSYIRLLSKFVTGYDCHGDSAGTAGFDICGICTGGNTGRDPATEPCNCQVFSRKSFLNIAACEQFVSASGKYTWTTSGNYNDTILASDGCDSILFYNLSIHHPSSDTRSVTSCGEYTSPGGKKWTESGVYADTLTSLGGCDSIIIITLTIPELNISVSQSEDTLFAEPAGAAYRWLQCDNGFQAVEGATGQSFTPAQSGQFAAEITLNTCTDTSACYTIDITGFILNEFGANLAVFPNPAEDRLYIRLPEAYEATFIEIRNLAGQTLLKEQYNRLQTIVTKFDIPAGMYILMIRNGLNQNALVKVMVE